MVNRINSDVSVLVIVKGEERYVFMYDDDHEKDTVRQLGRFASNSDLSFTWLDAAVLSKKIRSSAS